MEYEIAPVDGVDYPDKECVTRATCGPKQGYICTSNC